MSVINIVPAICKTCYTEQFYTIVYSWDSNDKLEYPKNVCKKCGKLLDFGDVDINNCSPDDRKYMRMVKIYYYWTDHYASDYDYYITQDELDKAEEEMISKGLITSKQEEKEYEEKYFERLENKYKNGSDSNSTQIKKIH